MELTSRVAAYYGESIRAQAREVLEALGIEHGKLTIIDEGALPFVIEARIEAAVLRSGVVTGTNTARARTRAQSALLAAADAREFAHSRTASARDRLRRSRLYLPGNEPKYFINAALHGPDAVILDLEDSVHHAEKDAARILVRNTLRAVDFDECEVMVRINQLPLGLVDLDFVIPQRPHMILIPKVERVEQVTAVDRRIQEIDPEATIWLMPILESALGIENAFEIVRASERVCALTIGLEDYTADLGVIKTPQGTESLFARHRLVNAAKAAGVQAIDSVYGDVTDLDGLGAWGKQSYAMGFEGMGCIHPGQIPVIHQAFAPGEKELEKARAMVAAFEDAQARGVGVVSLGSKMIDMPVVQRAIKLVERARKMGLNSAGDRRIS